MFERIIKMRLKVIVVALFFVGGLYGQSAQRVIEQAESLTQSGHYEQVIQLLTDNKEVILATEYWGYLFFYEMALGIAHFQKNDFEKSEEFFLRARIMLGREAGRESEYYLSILTDIFIPLYSQMNDIDKLVGIYLEIIAIYEVVRGRDMYYVARLNQVGNIFMSLGRYEAARELYYKAKRICEEIGDLGIDYSISIHNIGKSYEFLGNIETALAYMLRAKEIQSEILDTNSHDFFNTISSLANYYAFLQQYDLAVYFSLKALEISRVLFGINSDWYIEHLRRLGAVYVRLGNNRLSEKYYNRAKSAIEESIGVNNELFATVVRDLGVVHMDMSNYIVAAYYLRQARYIAENLYNTNQEKYASIYATTLHRIGRLFLNLGTATGNLEDAKINLLKAKDIQSRWEYGSICWGRTVGDLALLYIHLGEYELAGQHIGLAKVAIERNFGRETTEYLTVLNSAALLAAVTWNDVLATRYFAELSELSGRVLDRTQYEYLRIKSNVGFFFFIQSKFDIAAKYRQEALDALKGYVYRNFGIMGTVQRQNSLLFGDMHSMLEINFNLLAAHTTPKTQVLSYNSVLFTSGLLLRFANEIRNIIMSSGNPTLINQFEELRTIRQQITALQSRTDNYNPNLIQTLEARADNLDRALTAASTAYRDLQAELNIEWQDVRNQLSANEVAIEFIDFQLFDREWTDTVMYAALLLRHNSEVPVFIPLFQQSQLDSILTRVSGRGRIPIGNLFENYGHELYQLIWQPLEEYLQGIETIFYSPSGSLHQIAFSAMRVGESFLIDKYDLQRVSSTREVVSKRREQGTFLPINKVVLYGGILYDIADEQALINAARYTQSSQSHPFTSHFLPDDVTRGGQNRWDFLQGTENEVWSIADLLRESNIPHRYFMGIQATEESFKQLSGNSPDLLHIVTHGFFLADEERVNRNPFMQMMNRDNRVMRNPLLRSGLVFAGANRAWRNIDVIPGIEDGVLTAEEIAHLDLSNTRLVVLSACDTGLGEVRSSEGVFGLQRAFKLAGVQTIVMTLWRVDDRVTSVFMIDFYRNLLSGMTRRDAFVGAQKMVRERYRYPYFWAGFVMID